VSDASARTDAGRDPGTLTTDVGASLEAEPGGLDPRYDGGGEIGRGGGGRVVRAVDRRLDRPVAVKMPLSLDPSARARLEREARVMARLEHPGIVPVHDAGRLTDGTPYYAMKLLGGRTLRDVVRAAATLDERLVLVPHVLAVAEAVAYAHARRIIHRDLKPSNVLVGEFGETVVIDWGLAKDLAAADDDEAAEARGELPSADRTVTGAVMGTPQYMAPEQARGEPVGERADVYALGAILYDLLAGAPPYKSSESSSVVTQVLAGPPPPVAEAAPGAPRDLVAIVETAMARDAAGRYPTAIELAEDLRRYLGGRLVAAHQYSAAALARRWVRRHRGAVAIGAVALAAVATIGVISARRVIAERDRAEAALAETDRARAGAEARRVGAEELIDFMLFDLRDRLAAIGRLDALDGVGAKVDAYYRTVAADAGVDPATVRRRARALAILGVVAQRRGDLDGAATPSALSLALTARLVPAGAPDDLEAFAAGWIQLGDIYQARSDVGNALAAYGIARRFAEQMSAASPTSAAWSFAVAQSHERLGRLAEVRGDHPTKTAEYGAVRVVLAPVVARGDATDAMQRLYADGLEKLADDAYERSDFAAAQAGYEDARAIWRRVSAAHPDDAGARHGVGRQTMWVGMMEMLRDQLDDADAEYRAAGAIFDDLVAREPGNVEWLGSVEMLHKQRASLAEDRHDKRAELAETEAALVVAKQVAAHAPANPDYQRDVAMSSLDLGEMQDELGDRASAEQTCRAALAIADGLGARDPGNRDWETDRGELRAVLARLLGGGREAHALADEARRIVADLRDRGQDSAELHDLEERLPALDALR
jgi:hypothetical protein